jgi:hypothetical protein
VTLVEKHAAEALRQAVTAAYKAKYGIEPDIFFTTPATGAGIVDIRADASEDPAHQRVVMIYKSAGVCGHLSVCA